MLRWDGVESGVLGRVIWVLDLQEGVGVEVGYMRVGKVLGSGALS